MFSRNKLLPALAVSVAAVAAIGTETASAANCTGSERVLGRGASFANLAHNDLSNGWIVNADCVVGTKDATFAGGDDLVFYEGLGSGAGLNAFGATGGVRDQTVGFIGTDDPPSPTQKASMQEGNNPSSANVDGDDGKYYSVPVLQGATAVIVNLPSTCRRTSGNAYLGRFKIPAGPGGATNSFIEKVFSAENTTWASLGLVNISGGAPCSAPIKRVVRRDNSGTTFMFKRFLASTDEGASTDWAAIDTTAEDNTRWPDGTGTGIAPKDSDGTCDGVNSGTPVSSPYTCNNTANGNGSLAAMVAATDGSIGYADLATARSAGFDVTSGGTDHNYWLPLYVPGTGSPVTQLRDPQKNPEAYKAGTVTADKGAYCTATTYGINGGTTLPGSPAGDWSLVYQRQYGNVYPLCALSYMGAWSDYEDVYPTVDYATLSARQAAVKRYFEFILGTDALGGTNEGQKLLPTADYWGLNGTTRAIANVYLTDSNFDQLPDRAPIRP